jgi:hypothetical protein
MLHSLEAAAVSKEQCRLRLDKLIIAHLVKKLPEFHGKVLISANTSPYPVPDESKCILLVSDKNEY